MLRAGRTLVWLRWRLLMNSLQRTERRDRWQRVSLAIESLAPVLALLVLGPALLLSATLGVAAGWLLGSAHPRASLALGIVRAAALAAFAIALLAPVLSVGGRRPADTRRLLLLPLPRRTLYLSELAGALADPWMLVTLPAFALLPAGALLAGRPGLAFTAAAAAALFLVTLAGLSLAVATLAQLALRRRRVAELLGVLLVFLPLLIVVPQLLDHDRREARTTRRAPRVEHSPRAASGRLEAAQGWLALIPSELYTAALARGPGRPGLTVLLLAGLAAGASGAHVVSWRAYRRLLADPGDAGAGGQHGGLALWSRRVPGLSPGASAVATATLRLVVRTPRGRVILLAPFVAAAAFGAPFLAVGRGGSLGPLGAVVDPGLGLALAVAVFGLIAAGPVTLNQFAVDGPALGLQILAPLPPRELLAGKAAALGLVCGVPTLAALVAVSVVVPPASFALWSGLVVALPGALGLLAPCWAMLSAVFPRTATLASLKNSASNPHSAAHLLGLAALAGAAAPPAALAGVALGLLGRPALVVPLMAGWAAVAWWVGRALFAVAVRLFERRVEALQLVALGRA